MPGEAKAKHKVVLISAVDFRSARPWGVKSVCSANVLTVRSGKKELPRRVKGYPALRAEPAGGSFRDVK
jgi:hypothetical protein